MQKGERRMVENREKEVVKLVLPSLSLSRTTLSSPPCLSGVFSSLLSQISLRCRYLSGAQGVFHSRRVRVCVCVRERQGQRQKETERNRERANVGLQKDFGLKELLSLFPGVMVTGNGSSLKGRNTLDKFIKVKQKQYSVK